MLRSPLSRETPAHAYIAEIIDDVAKNIPGAMLCGHEVSALNRSICQCNARRRGARTTARIARRTEQICDNGWLQGTRALQRLRLPCSLPGCCSYISVVIARTAATKQSC